MLNESDSSDSDLSFVSANDLDERGTTRRNARLEQLTLSSELNLEIADSDNDDIEESELSRKEGNCKVSSSTLSSKE